MELSNLNKVSKLSKKLAEVDSEIECLDLQDLTVLSFAVGDFRCGQSWGESRQPQTLIQKRMAQLIKESLQEVRSGIVAELISLGVKP